MEILIGFIAVFIVLISLAALFMILSSKEKVKPVSKAAKIQTPAPETTLANILDQFDKEESTPARTSSHLSEMTDEEFLNNLFGEDPKDTAKQLKKAATTGSFGMISNPRMNTIISDPMAGGWVPRDIQKQLEQAESNMLREQKRLEMTTGMTIDQLKQYLQRSR